MPGGSQNSEAVTNRLVRPKGDGIQVEIHASGDEYRSDQDSEMEAINELSGNHSSTSPSVSSDVTESSFQSDESSSESSDYRKKVQEFKV